MKYLGSFYHVTTEVQRILNRLAALEQSVSAGSGGGGIPFDDTAGITALTDMRGWDGSGGGHSITLQGSDLVLRGSNSILFQTPAILAAAAASGWVLTLVDPLTGVCEFTELPGGGGSYLPLAGGTMSGAINMGSQKITSLGTPTASTDGTTKLYVDQNDDTIETVNVDLGLVSGGVTNNLDPGSTTATRLSLMFAADPLTLTGIVAPAHSNRILYLQNGSYYPISLAFQDTRSSAANRFASGINITTIGSYETVMFVYGNSRWVPRFRFPGVTDTREILASGSYIAAGGQSQFFAPFSFLRNAYGNNLVVISPYGTTDAFTYIIEVFNATGGAVIIENEGSAPLGTTTSWLIRTPSGANVTWPDLTLARFAYDRVALRWRLLNTPA